ncbi:MAG TPA: Wzz/FepE/Etk N-terminal domain-containing protein [Solirubrobacteraceae bacterium]|jgi:hypothetical protein|nr:Wzz/FepE/Etk N-terminal domain-containing protein [Solirubrobacteraceae bacterium]
MDLVEIMGKIWRHKLATIPVLILTVAGLAYTTVIKPKVYQAQASYLLIPPPQAPTPQQIAAHPALAKVNTNNPYVRFNDLTVIVSLLAQTETSNTTRNQLVAQGADPNYQIGPNVQFGTDPIIQITGSGPTPAAAIKSATVVGKSTIQMLTTLQAQQGVNSTYMISALPLTAPSGATLQVSSLLRTAVSVLALGVIVLFIVVSTLSGIEERREQRRPRLFLGHPRRPEPDVLEVVPSEAPVELQPANGKSRPSGNLVDAANALEELVSRSTAMASGGTNGKPAVAGKRAPSAKRAAGGNRD